MGIWNNAVAERVDEHLGLITPHGDLELLQ